MARPIEPRTPSELMIDRYSAYLLQRRGLSRSTVRNYANVAREFVADRERRQGELVLGELDAVAVNAFVLREARRASVGSAKCTVTRLRSLLRFLHVEGEIKALTIVQSILSFAVSAEIVEFNAAAAVRKPRYTRARERHILLPDEVERIRAQLQARDRTLVSVLACSGPRPEEIVCRLAWGDVGEQSIRYVDSKRRRIRFSPLLPPLAQDLREWVPGLRAPPRPYGVGHLLQG
jgi:integrase